MANHTKTSHIKKTSHCLHVKKKKSYTCNRDSETADLLKSVRKKEWVGDYLFPGKEREREEEREEEREGKQKKAS